LELGALATLISAPAAIGLNAVVALVLLLPIMTLTPLLSTPVAETRGATKPEDRIA
jgi:hypothetical protein